MSKTLKRNSGNFATGLILILIGGWFLLRQLGLNLPGIGNLWPIFPTLGGLAIIGLFLRNQEDEGVLVPGVAGFLIGIFFFFFTLGIFEWAEMGQLWPVFPLIGGLAFLATWLGGGRHEPGLLVPAFGGLAVGVIGLVFTLGGFGVSLIVNYWPVILILVGLWVLAQNLIRQGK